MEIISDFQEDQTETETETQPSSSAAKTSTFTSSFDPSNPLGIVETVLDFLSKESDFLEKPTAEKEIGALVKAAAERKKKRKAEEREKEREALQKAERSKKKKEEEQEVKENGKEVMEDEKKEGADTRASEKFRLLESPHGRPLDFNTWVGSLSGCLCLSIHYKEGEGPVDGGRGVDLWMMKEYGVGSSWIKLLSLPITSDFIFLMNYPILFSNEEGNMVAMFDHIYPEETRNRHRYAAPNEIMRLQIEKGAMVNFETLLRFSKDRDYSTHVYDYVSNGTLYQNYALLHMEESLVSLN